MPNEPQGILDALSAKEQSAAPAEDVNQKIIAKRGRDTDVQINTRAGRMPIAQEKLKSLVSCHGEPVRERHRFRSTGGSRSQYDATSLVAPRLPFRYRLDWRAVAAIQVKSRGNWRACGAYG